MFEFEFIFNNSQDPLYIPHDTNVIDIELIMFLNQIDFDWNDLLSFSVINLN